MGSGGAGHTQDGKAERGFFVAGALVAMAAVLPFARMFLSGQSLFFRDLSVSFFPERRFFLESLARGDWTLWNPLIHEGVPIALPLHAYLPDFLQLLLPNEFGFSFFLALHVPFAAISFFLLARHLKLEPEGAATAALVYSLGGFTMSMVNLYYAIQAAAWGPLFIIAFRRAVLGGRARDAAFSAVAFAMLISTLGIEIALQICLLSAVLAPPSDPRRFLRSAASVTLGIALSAAILLPLILATRASERSAGMPTWVVLSNSIHPLTFLQVLIANLYGDVSNLSGTWWGTNFFSNGFPYYLSLYLGPTVLALAWAGATLSRHPFRRRLVVLCAVGALVGLGKYAGLEALFDWSPSLRVLRYPVKAFFTVEFSIALLAALAVSDIRAGNASVARRVGRTSLCLGGILVGSVLLPLVAPSSSAQALAGFVPPGFSLSQQLQIAWLVTSDASMGGLVCLVAGTLALMAGNERLPPARVAAALAVLVGADLIRCGAGLNASVTQDFYSLSPEMAGQVESLRLSGGRAFTCDPEASDSYWAGRHARGAHSEAFSMAVLQETLTPLSNLSRGVRTALSIDKNSLVPSERFLSVELSSCRDFAQIVPALRGAGVNRVLSLDPLNDPALQLLAEISPARIAPVTIRIYELTGARPRFSLPVTVVEEASGLLALRVAVDRPSALTVLDPFAPGWLLTVNGAAQPILRTADGHREIPLQRGRNEVVMNYEPPGLRLGLGITSIAVLLCAGFVLRSGSRAGGEDLGWVERRL